MLGSTGTRARKSDFVDGYGGRSVVVSAAQLYPPSEMSHDDVLAKSLSRVSNLVFGT